MRLAQGRLVVHGVEHERVLERHGRVALDRELGHAEPPVAEPALSHSSTLPPGSISAISTPGASLRSSAGVPWSSGNVP